MIIAEIGQNFLGNMDLARSLIHLAKVNGADLAKFQLYDHKQLYKDHPEIPNVELSFNQAKILFDYGTEVGIEVFFSVFDVERVKWCEEIGVKRYKIACSQTDNLVLLDAISDTGKPCFISYKDAFSQTWLQIKGNVSLLYCPSGYPAREVSFESNFYEGWADGFSDHTLTLTASKVAISRGAKIIERHFAIDHHMGIDALWSMTPTELRDLRRFFDEAQKCL